MRVCEMVWTPERAERVSAEVEKITGEPCPCKVGRACPFVKAPVDQPRELQRLSA